MKRSAIEQLGDGAIAPIHAYIISSRLFFQAGGFHDKILFGEDWWLWIQAVRKTDKIEVIPSLVAGYFITNGSLSKNPQRIFEQSVFLCQEARNKDHGKYCTTPLEAVIAKWLLTACGVMIQQQDPDSVVNFFIRNIQQYRLKVCIEDLRNMVSYNFLQGNTSQGEISSWLDENLLNVWKFINGIQNHLSGDAVTGLAIFISEFSSSKNRIVSPFINKTMLKNYFISKIKSKF